MSEEVSIKGGLGTVIYNVVIVYISRDLYEILSKIYFTRSEEKKDNKVTLTCKMEVCGFLMMFFTARPETVTN